MRPRRLNPQPGDTVRPATRFDVKMPAGVLRLGPESKLKVVAVTSGILVVEHAPFRFSVYAKDTVFVKENEHEQ